MHLTTFSKEAVFVHPNRRKPLAPNPVPLDPVSVERTTDQLDPMRKPLSQVPKAKSGNWLKEASQIIDARASLSYAWIQDNRIA
jgi:hypothetical protein